MRDIKKMGNRGWAVVDQHRDLLREIKLPMHRNRGAAVSGEVLPKMLATSAAPVFAEQPATKIHAP